MINKRLPQKNFSVILSLPKYRQSNVWYSAMLRKARHHIAQASKANKPFETAAVN